MLHSCTSVWLLCKDVLNAIPALACLSFFITATPKLNEFFIYFIVIFYLN